MVAVTSQWGEYREESPLRDTERVRLVRLLIKAGAHVNARDSDGKTPLMYAVGIWGGDLAVVEMLIVAGADVAAIEEYGDTALHGAAAWSGNPSVSMALVLGVCRI